jgi:tRNA dimethylallyltransferase
LNPFVLIVGPTAAGKSALGLALAQKYGGAILNCDSLQTYKRLDIGTAKPSPAERSLVPHFLFDYLEPGQFLTAGDFRREALRVLGEQLPERPVFGVGGSGFYIQALEKGMFDVPKPDPEIEAGVREEMDRRGSREMFQELERLDPEYAEAISPNDAYRLTRALVIIRESGKKVSDLRREFKPEKFPFPLLKMGLTLTREQLLPRVQMRSAQMLKDGLIEEVRQLLNEGHADWPPLQSVGYKETLGYLRGEYDLPRLEELLNEKTLQLAKKQRTWFQRDSEIHWLDAGRALEEASTWLDSFVQSPQDVQPRGKP